MSAAAVAGHVASGDEIRVSLNNGIAIETESLGTVRCDPSRPTGDYNVVSHAHGDHLPESVEDANLVCSPLTAKLACARRDLPAVEPVIPDEMTLYPSGHIDGSCAALIRDRGRRILYTGDIATRDRYGLNGFEPVAADILIIEATYGSSAYTFPPIQDIERDVLSWLDEIDEAPVVVFGYALGKAQRLVRLFEAVGDERVVTTEAIEKLNAVIAEERGVSFPTTRFERNGSLEGGDIVLLPSQLARFDWVQSFVNEQDAVTAGFSGWAADQSYIYRRGVDRGFPLSDHCDFTELLDVVEAVDPEIVYTHHGQSGTLATELTKRGYEARALRQHQTTIDSFG